MQIGIVGNGNVGRACAEGFHKHGFTVYVNDVRPLPHNEEKLTLWKMCDLIFICVPTPNLRDGNIDLSFIHQVLNDFQALPYTHTRESADPVFIVKSTVTPGTTRQLEKAYPCFKFACNPEFLRAEHALKDFLDPDRIVVGANDSETMEKVKMAYQGWKTTPQIWTDTSTAELIKYLSNCYLVAKVAFALESKHICELLGVNAKTVLDGVSLDRRINRSHLDPDKGQIPGDSPCLPKDLRAFRNYLVENTGYFSVLLNVIGQLGIDWHGKKE